MTEFTLPMPNDTLTRWEIPGIVIASSWVTDDVAAVLVLRDRPPFYAVYQIWNDRWNLPASTRLGVLPNIVPAAVLYNDTAGCW